MPLTRPTHLQLATPAVTVAAATLALAGLADAATEGDGVARLDPHVAADVLDLRSGALTTVARTLSLIGSEMIVSVLALLLVIVLLERRGAWRAGLAAVAMSAAAALTVGVKLAVGRDRPGAADRLGALDNTYSFPSGHTLNSAVLLGTFCLLLVPLMHHRAARLTASAAAALLAVGIGASRVYLGYHWTTDVLASWVIAAALLAIVHLADRFVIPPEERSGSSQVLQCTVDT